MVGLIFFIPFDLLFRDLPRDLVQLGTVRILYIHLPVCSQELFVTNCLFRLMLKAIMCHFVADHEGHDSGICMDGFYQAAEHVDLTCSA